MKLIYHLPQSANTEDSPFELKVRALVNDGAFNIACPYIDVDFLKGLLESNPRFRLLTDVEKWIESYNGPKRKAIVAFIKANQDHIHHQNGLHAKVVANKTHAMIGSANLTGPGMKSNNEFSVFIDSVEEVEEITNWFDSWWEKTDVSDLEKVKEFADYCDQIEIRKPKAKKRINSKAPEIRFEWASPKATYIEGTFRGLANYYKDGKEKFEIHIPSRYSDILPVVDGERVPMKLVVGGREYEVGLRYTIDGGIWISPDAFRDGQKIRLADIVELHGIQRNQKVQLDYDKVNRILLIA